MAKNPKLQTRLSGTMPHSALSGLVVQTFPSTSPSCRIRSPRLPMTSLPPVARSISKTDRRRWSGITTVPGSHALFIAQSQTVTDVIDRAARGAATKSQVQVQNQRQGGLTPRAVANVSVAVHRRRIHAGQTDSTINLIQKHRVGSDGACSASAPRWRFAERAAGHKIEKKLSSTALQIARTRLSTWRGDKNFLASCTKMLSLYGAPLHTAHGRNSPKRSIRSSQPVDTRDLSAKAVMPELRVDDQAAFPLPLPVLRR